MIVSFDCILAALQHVLDTHKKNVYIPAENLRVDGNVQDLEVLEVTQLAR